MDSVSQSRIWLVVGLGNPGTEYERTYHNVGFRVVGYLANRHNVRVRQACGPAMISDRFVVEGQTAVLVLPQTFMNRSGLVLPKLFERFGSTVKDMIVVYDELALPLGKLRVRESGSAGGHNGMKSLIATAGSDEFMRVRVGITPNHPIGDARDFVLSRVSKSHRIILDQTEELAARAVETLLVDGIEKAMAIYNGVDLRDVEETQ